MEIKEELYSGPLVQCMFLKNRSHVQNLSPTFGEAEPYSISFNWTTVTDASEAAEVISSFSYSSASASKSSRPQAQTSKKLQHAEQ
jgi:hypothetical protein